MDLTERLAVAEVASDAAVDAGELLLEHLGSLAPEDIRRKSSFRDLVTRADVASERLLVSRLREIYPDHTIEAEEETCDEEDDRPRWFLDPLDGTVNFVHRLPCFAVSMGLWMDGVPQVGVVHAPLLGETFVAVRGGGAQVNGEPMAVSPTEEVSEAILATGFAYRRSELQPSNLEQFASFFHVARGLRRMGSAALDLAYVADGRLDGFWEYHLSAHDVAAGGLLVQEAGGIVTAVGGGPDWLRGGSILAAGPDLHRLMGEHLAQAE